MANFETQGATWRKSSRSSNQGYCVEVAFTEHGIAARDSKHPHGDSLLFPRARWNDFLRSLDHARSGT